MPMVTFEPFWHGPWAELRGARMKLTCITSAFNEGALLLDTVASVLNQSYRDFQYIIVEDGADAATREALSTIKDQRILLITQDNAGPSAARNAALEQVSGDYVCFLDADDIRPNWAFQAMADLVERDDPDLILCRGMVSDERGNLQPFYDTPRFEEIRARTPERPISRAHSARPLAALLEPQSANKLVRTSLIRDHSLHFPAPYFFEDVFFHMAALGHAGRLSFLHTPVFCYFRRYNRARITASDGKRRFDIIPVVSRTLSDFARGPDFVDPDYRAAVLAACFKLVAWCQAGIAPEFEEGFQQRAADMTRTLDPLYLTNPDFEERTVGGIFPEVSAARTYIRALCPELSE